MLSILSALTLLQASAAASPADALAYGQWKTMSTQQLAAKLLPRRLARTVVAHKVEPKAGPGSPLFAVIFFAKPRPSLDGFCERRRYLVHASADASMVEGIDIRLGACPAAFGAEFAHLNPTTPAAEAKGALRWLQNAAAVAQGSKPLPFDIDCVAEAEPARCADGGRAALAMLRPENSYVVDGAFSCQPGEIDFAVRQEALPAGIAAAPIWKVRLEHAGQLRSRLQMTWAMPAPF